MCYIVVLGIMLQSCYDRTDNYETKAYRKSREPGGPVPGTLCHQSNTINRKKSITIQILTIAISTSLPNVVKLFIKPTEFCLLLNHNSEIDTRAFFFYILFLYHLNKSFITSSLTYSDHYDSVFSVYILDHAK